MGNGRSTDVGFNEAALQERPPLEHVILDWNGTLLADTKACLEAANQVLIAFDAQPVSLTVYRETLSIPTIDFYVRHGADRGRLESELDRWSRTFHETYERAAAQNRTRPGARLLLTWLGQHSIPRVILSNHTVQGIGSQLDRLKLAGHVDKLLARDLAVDAHQVSLRQTKEEKLRIYLADKGANKARVAIVGDAPEEVHIGRRTGIWTIAITSGYYSTRRLREAQPDFLVHSLAEAMGALTRIRRGPQLSSREMEEERHVRNALILHGTDGSPDSHWFQWLATALRQRGYEVTVPALPQADHPDLDRYWKFLRDFDFNPETIIVGHSSGATTALALLHKLPAGSRVRLVVSVAGFYRDDGFKCERLFTEPYDWVKIRGAADDIVLLWSPGDPFIVEEQTQVLADRLGVTPTVIEGCSHFSIDNGGPRFHEFPEVLNIIDTHIRPVKSVLDENSRKDDRYL
jgi:uncharacterized protein